MQTIIAFTFLALLLFVLSSIVWWTVANGISPMPTTGKAKNALLDHLPKNPVGPIYELGSGWGTLLIPLARMHPHIRVIGYESSPIPFYISWFWMRLFGINNISLFKDDFFKADLSNASVIICYLYPGAMYRLKDKFENELRSGTIVISNTFAVPGWHPLETIKTQDFYQTKIYLYKK